MHAISSYRGNRPTNIHTNTHTNKQTNPQTGPITIHCKCHYKARLHALHLSSTLTLGRCCQNYISVQPFCCVRHVISLLSVEDKPQFFFKHFYVVTEPVRSRSVCRLFARFVNNATDKLQSVQDVQPSGGSRISGKGVTSGQRPRGGARGVGHWGGVWVCPPQKKN